jgi:hypothetical protein
MPESSQQYREAARRLHRKIAVYLVLRAWRERAECIALDRTVLKPLLQLRAIQDQHVEWIKNDMAQWFPCIRGLYAKKSVEVIYFSRVPLGRWMDGKMSDAERVRAMANDGVHAVLIDYRDRLETSEEKITAELALLAGGLNLPAAVPGPK